MKKRVYDSTSRKVQASQTKERLLSAAKKLFKTKGVENTTIEDIATSAKVSIPTVYSLFQSKLGILRALLDTALAQDQYDALVEKAISDKSPRKRLETTAAISRQLYDAEKTIIDLLRGASALDPKLKKLEEEREKRRYFRQEDSMKDFADKGYLKEGLPLTQAQDILWAFTGRDLYKMLVIERGWPSENYEKWLADLLIHSLLRK